MRKKDNTLPEIVEGNSNSLTPKNTTTSFLGRIFSELQPGESTNIGLRKNKNGSATIKCPDQGETLVAHPSGKTVRYSYDSKKK